MLITVLSVLQVKHVKFWTNFRLSKSCWLNLWLSKSCWVIVDSTWTWANFHKKLFIQILQFGTKQRQCLRPFAQSWNVKPCLGLLSCLVDKHLCRLAKGVFGDENSVESSIHKLGISNENRVRKSSNLMPMTVITIAFRWVWLRVQAAVRWVIMTNVAILHEFKQKSIFKHETRFVCSILRAFKQLLLI